MTDRNTDHSSTAATTTTAALAAPKKEEVVVVVNDDVVVEAHPLPCPVSVPRRYIYNDTDVQHFLSSPSKHAIYNFTVAMGKSCATTTTTMPPPPYESPTQPSLLLGLSPGIACLHGALSVMQNEWVYHDFPPTTSNTIGNRFGNPIFRVWHTQLQQRSYHIIATVLYISHEYSKVMMTKKKNTTNEINDEDDEFEIELLIQAQEAGKAAARRDTTTIDADDKNSVYMDACFNEQDRAIVTELSYYLHDAFGHAIRLDYGTGHETSFHIFLFLLCQLRVFHNMGYNNHNSTIQNLCHESGDTETDPVKSDTSTIPSQQQQQQVLPSVQRCKANIISIYHQYLQVTRALQTEYMLEPAGSHGVWGLDDYHCLPFYFGACQLIPLQQQQPHDDIFVPSSIHNDQILQQYGDTYLYYGCIRFIKSIKKNVPFFESSPMLNDISQIATWYKISSGLIKLYEGEVLSKRPVVQHLIFGALFPANWIPSQTDAAMVPPTEIFRIPTTATTATTTTKASVASSNHSTVPIVETRAPWAK